MIVFSIIILGSTLTACNPKEVTEPIVTMEDNAYLLDVYLDTEQDLLKVKGSIEYINEMEDLDELFLMLYPNATTNLNRQDNVLMKSLIIEGMKYPFVYANEDRTAMYIELLESYDSGDVLTIEFEYEFKYWDFDRLNHQENYYLTMFFYPFVAMHDETGWNTEPYTFSGETYYNSIGDYDVTINVPSDYLIATSGFLQESTVEEERIINNYTIEDARDFSFSASSEYTFYEKDVNGMLFHIYSLGELTNTELNDSFGYLENSFNLYNDIFGHYNQDHFTLEYGHFYGMESTGVIYCSREISEGTVVHEIVHQWFYSMVGNDQYDNSFLDEALTTYSSALYYLEFYGEPWYRGQLDYRDSAKDSLAVKYNQSSGRSLLDTVDEMDDLYGFLIYYHGTTLITHYVDYFLAGDTDRFAEILHKYFDTYYLEEATLDNFLDLLQEESGKATTKEWFMMELQSFQNVNNRP